MKKIALFLCLFAAASAAFSQACRADFTSGATHNPCGTPDRGLNRPETFEITRGEETFVFRVFRDRYRRDTFGIEYAEMIRQFRVTLERLPTAHLRELQPVRFICGKLCTGGGSAPCRDASGNFQERAAITISFESFRGVSDGNDDIICHVCPIDPATGDRMRRCDESQKVDENKRGNVGGWNETEGFNSTVLHEVGHFMDYRYCILNRLEEAQKTDCATCARRADCYGAGATNGPNETIAEAYMSYFMQKKWWEALGCASATDCAAGRSPTVAENQPSPRSTGVFTAARLAYLTESLAWENWD